MDVKEFKKIDASKIGYLLGIPSKKLEAIIYY